MRIALVIPLSFNLLPTICDAFSKKYTDGFFTHITTDSREALPNDLFFSLSRDEESAKEHIKAAKSAGAVTVSSLAKSGDFMVADCEKALLKLASFYKTRLKYLKATVAITGSVGKTTTKEFCAAFFKSSHKTHKTYMNYNNALGVSLSLLTAPSDTEILILELGMNALGEIKELSEAIAPDFAVITNIGNAHIGKLGSRELIARAKLEIASGMNEEKIIAPLEEPLLSSAAFKFSIENPDAEFYLAEANNGKTSFYHNGEKIIEFTTSHKASHHKKALSVALALGSLLSLDKEKMLSGIKNCESVSLRQKIIKFKRFNIFDDTYSSSPEAVAADIEFLKLAYPNCTFSLALGDMLELGKETEKLHKEIGRLAFLKGARKLYAFGSYAYFIKEGALALGMEDTDILICTDTDSYAFLAEEIYRRSVQGEIVLIKASHALHSEKIIEEIERFDKEC